jgi:hypothetical protein
MPHLHLVQPAGDGVRKPGRMPRTVPTLTRPESDRLKAALRNLRLRFGTWSCLAAVMGCRPETLAHVAAKRGRPTGAHALAAARAAGTTVEAEPSPQINPKRSRKAA